MESVMKFTAGLLVFAFTVGTFITTDALAAEPGGGEPEESGSEFGTMFWIGIGAVVGIAAIAIWQGVSDSKNKKDDEQIRETEDLEIGEFDEYFRSLPADEPGGPTDDGTDDDAGPEYALPLTERSDRGLGIGRVLR